MHKQLKTTKLITSLTTAAQQYDQVNTADKWFYYPEHTSLCIVWTAPCSAIGHMLTNSRRKHSFTKVQRTLLGNKTEMLCYVTTKSVNQYILLHSPGTVTPIAEIGVIPKTGA